MGARGEDVTDAGDSIVRFEQWLDRREQALLEAIETYNEVDCVSTVKLHRWLLERRDEAERRFATTIPWRLARTTRAVDPEASEDEDEPRLTEPMRLLNELLRLVERAESSPARSDPIRSRPSTSRRTLEGEMIAARCPATKRTRAALLDPSWWRSWRPGCAARAKRGERGRWPGECLSHATSTAFAASSPRSASPGTSRCGSPSRTNRTPCSTPTSGCWPCCRTSAARRRGSTPRHSCGA